MVIRVFEDDGRFSFDGGGEGGSGGCVACGSGHLMTSGNFYIGKLVCQSFISNYPFSVTPSNNTSGR